MTSNFDIWPTLRLTPLSSSFPLLRPTRGTTATGIFYNFCPSFFTLSTFFRSPSSPLASFSKWGKAEQRRKRRLSKPDFLCIHFNSRASCSSLRSSMSTPQKSIFRALYKLPWPPTPRQVGPFLEHWKQCFFVRITLQGHGQWTILHSPCMCRFCLFARFQSLFVYLPCAWTTFNYQISILRYIFIDQCKTLNNTRLL